MGLVPHLTGLGGGNSLRLLPLTPTSTSSSATFPFRLRKEPEQPVSTLVFEDRHTSHCSAGCFSRSHILPKPLFLDSGSLHHGNRFGSSQSIPRWSLRLCRRGATLKKNAAWPTRLLSCFNCLFWLVAQAQGFFCRGMRFTMPGGQAAVSHPSRCEPHALLTPMVIPRSFQSLSEIRRGQSQMVRQTLVSAPALVPCGRLHSV